MKVLSGPVGGTGWAGGGWESSPGEGRREGDRPPAAAQLGTTSAEGLRSERQLPSGRLGSKGAEQGRRGGVVDEGRGRAFDLVGLRTSLWESVYPLLGRDHRLLG